MADTRGINQCERKIVSIDAFADYLLENSFPGLERVIPKDLFIENLKKDQKDEGVNIYDAPNSLNRGKDSFTIAEANRFLIDYYINKRIKEAPITQTIAEAIPRYFRMNQIFESLDFPVERNEGRPIILSDIRDLNSIKGIIFSEKCKKNSPDYANYTEIKLAGLELPLFPSSRNFTSMVMRTINRFKELDSVDLEEEEQVLVKRLIGRKIIYYNKLVQLVAEDLQRYVIDNQRGRFLIIENREADGVGPVYAMRYNESLINLASLQIDPPSVVTQYIRERLPLLMKEKGMKIYMRFKESGKRDYSRLRKFFESRDKSFIKKLAPENTDAPAIVFASESADIFAANLEDFYKQNSDMQGDLGAALVAITLAWPEPNSKSLAMSRYQQLALVTDEEMESGNMRDYIFHTIGYEPVLVEEYEEVITEEEEVAKEGVTFAKVR